MTEAYLELMGQKTIILEKILTLTKGTVFSGEKQDAEKDAEAFAELYERREKIIKRIEKIEAEMAALNLPPAFGPEMNEAVDSIIDQQKAIAAQLLKLDEANTEMYHKIKAHVQLDMKNVRQGLDVNEAYADTYVTGEGSYFDKKN